MGATIQGKTANCPNSSGYTPKSYPPESYLKDVANVARWSKRSGCKGILVYSRLCGQFSGGSLAAFDVRLRLEVTHP